MLVVQSTTMCSLGYSTNCRVAGLGPRDTPKPTDCNLFVQVNWGSEGKRFLKCQFASIVHPENKSLVTAGCFAQLGLWKDFPDGHTERQQEYELQACDEEAVVAVQKARQDCKEKLCDLAKSGKWYGILSWSHTKGKQQPWPGKSFSPFTTGYEKQIRKSCSSLLSKAGDTSFVEAYYAEMSMMSVPISMNYMDKTKLCGCRTKDICD